jgi:hypothetical protein
MAIFDLFSKRQKRIRGQVPDVYQYEEFDQRLKVQIIHIAREAIGMEGDYNHETNEVYQCIHEILCKEYGLFTLHKNTRSNMEAVFNFLLNCSDYEQCLDVVDLCFKMINKFVRENWWRFQSATGVKQDPDSAIQELNDRFKEAGLGYQFESGEIIRIDSKIIHSEVVKPVLVLLGTEVKYAGANDEFLKAHEHYRHGRHKECLVECLKAFESLLKAICEKNSWAYDRSATAKPLINICFEKDLIPSYLQSQFSSLRSLLESGTPTIRNKEGGHGQGTEVTNVPEHLASYVLHLTATNMLFLANCQAAKGK